jgi:hypothetical protein
MMGGLVAQISNKFKWSESLKRTLAAWGEVPEDDIEMHVKRLLNGGGWLHLAEDIFQT